MTDEYRDARQAQDKRYEDATMMSVADTHAQEYRDYFGIGDHAGRPVETRVTPKAWLVEHKAPAAPTDTVTPQQAFYLSGAQLVELAAAGDYVAGDEIVRRAVKRANKKVAA